MSKHTPGPWNATKFNPVTREIDDCYLYVEPGIAVIERKVKGRDQHDTANARLIAAAPDLFEALEALVKSNEDHNARVSLIVGKPTGWHDGYLDKARAAIAKARGEA